MQYGKPVTEIIKERHSCRSYTGEKINDATADSISRFLMENNRCPFDSKVRFKLITAKAEDSESLKSLGTYGVVKKPSAFIVGAAVNSEKNLEDYGYLMEKNILYATNLGLGSCWLGGTFNKSAFAKSIEAGEDEILPAVASLGHKANRVTITDATIRASAGSKNRMRWEKLFFNGDFTEGLGKTDAGKYQGPLEMLRLAPSASNKQPWRIIKESRNNIFHFYLQRTKSYDRTIKLFSLADLQRVDMGIAMCHFELTAVEENLKGKWEISDPGIKTGSDLCEYIVSWIG